MPVASIFNIIVPGYILGILSLMIFFIPDGVDGLSDRLGAIATIMLAFIATIPVLRAEIPKTPKMTFA